MKLIDAEMFVEKNCEQCTKTKGCECRKKIINEQEVKLNELKELELAMIDDGK